MKLFERISVFWFLIVLVGFLINNCHAQEWRWSDQKFMDAPEQNIQHLGAGLISFTLDNTTNLKWWQSDLIALSAGVAWEIKDGLIPYEKYGYWGGEGFSIMDIGIDITGIAINRVLWFSFKKIKLSILPYMK